MIRFLITATTSMLLSAVVIQAASAEPEHRHKQKPAVETAATPAVPDVAPEVQQWVGKTIDDILTDTGRVLNVDPDRKH